MNYLIALASVGAALVTLASLVCWLFVWYVAPEDPPRCEEDDEAVDRLEGIGYMD